MAKGKKGGAYVAVNRIDATSAGVLERGDLVDLPEDEAASLIEMGALKAAAPAGDAAQDG